MDNQQIPEAVIAFVQNPESFAELFEYTGQALDKQTIDSIKQDPEKTYTAIMQDETLLNALNQFYQQKKQTSMFAEGGKLAYGVKMFQKGGTVNPIPTKKARIDGVKANWL